MNFEIEYIEKLANLVDEKNLTEITVEDGDKAVIIKKGYMGAPAPTAPVQVAAPQTQTAAAPQSAPSTQAQ